LSKHLASDCNNLPNISLLQYRILERKNYLICSRCFILFYRITYPLYPVYQKFPYAGGDAATRIPVTALRIRHCPVVHVADGQRVLEATNRDCRGFTRPTSRPSYELIRSAFIPSVARAARARARCMSLIDDNAIRAVSFFTRATLYATL